MPTTFWVPLRGVDRPVPSRLLHAAFSSWFDGDPENPDAHHDNVKPYRLAPLSTHQGGWGIQISTITDSAAEALIANTVEGASVRLGSQHVQVDRPRIVRERDWGSIAIAARRRSWTITFLTPTMFRSGSHASPLPSPGSLLRSPTDVWRRFGPEPHPQVRGAEHETLWISRVDLETVDYEIARQHYPGALGSILLNCSDPEVAGKVSELLGLARFCGVGSFRGKGMGIVDIDSR